MIQQTIHRIDPTLLSNITLPDVDYRLALNTPTGRFFYDPWELKPEFKNTVWEHLLATLKEPIGEARIIKLLQGTCYQSHADIDDRYHLNIVGEQSYLIDLDDKVMHETVDKTVWYTMNTAKRHSAANFGSIARYQLVVRHLLKNNKLENPKKITVSKKSYDPSQDSRYIFDDIISPWLNYGCKNGYVGNVSSTLDTITFEVEHSVVDEFNELVSKTKLTVNYD